MGRLLSTTCILTLAAAGVTAGSAIAAPGGIPGRPGGGGEETEEAAHNLSYPVILPEALAPGGLPLDNPWRFEVVGDPAAECFTGDTAGEPVPAGFDCYWDGSQVWWLSKRLDNFWKAFSLAVDPLQHPGPVIITAVDIGDLLESSPNLNLRRIRTEVTLLQDAMQDPYFAAFVPAAYPVDFAGGTPAAPCVLPTQPSQSVGCFAAFAMTPVPGTEQSINELQGTNFGFDFDGPAHATATAALIDPGEVRFDDVAGIRFHATVYSRCARLVIQKLGSGEPVWDAGLGYWGTGANEPLVNIAAYRDQYTTEVNSSGTVIYGFNWNASQDNEGTGTYRLTYVLDGPPRCSLNALFSEGVTFVANPGELSPAQLIPYEVLNEDPDAVGTEEVPFYGGLAYVDVEISARGGGGGGRGGGGGGGRPGG